MSSGSAERQHEDRTFAILRDAQRQPCPPQCLNYPQAYNRSPGLISNSSITVGMLLVGMPLLPLTESEHVPHQLEEARGLPSS